MTSLTFKCNLSPKPATGITGEPPFHAFVKCGILLMAPSSSCITVSAPLVAAGLVGGGSSWREAVAAPPRSHEAAT